ncbi:uncharacterized protein EI90DRAFT_3053790 [Cantharellus anzutake]|uniref:uncharacterized protein n=1 Tax=Cantharellus anzutake TaxID=1750568 RepID=UPI001903C7B6|nr:uncharacterized protein EI90DRAFT_3053790 [Cantharellus anzutake]KAF8332623.1 hypothetical protein EI90DRAFT_3053790 [Cantharellus anzutake]
MGLWFPFAATWWTNITFTLQYHIDVRPILSGCVRLLRQLSTQLYRDEEGKEARATPGCCNLHTDAQSSTILF